MRTLPPFSLPVAVEDAALLAVMTKTLDDVTDVTK